MKFTDYYRNLSKDERASFAERSGTTVNYIEIHLLASPDKRKTPREPLMRALANESKGQCNFKDLLDHFYTQKDSAA